MTLEQLRASIAQSSPPAQLPPLLAALWWEAKGDWKRAHELAQDVSGPDGAWVHAYLHRREGDAGNAEYWYGQAGRARCALALEKEWEEIVSALLGTI
jgi:hypothetical protein